MRILHINSYYAAMGEPTFYKSFFETLLSKGIDISVFVPIPREMEVTSEQKFGEYSFVVKTHNNRDRYFFFPKQKKIFEDARKRFKNDSFDIIHAHSLFTNGYVANKLHHSFGIPYIVAVRNTDVNLFFRYMLHLRWIGYKILLEAEKIVFINESYKNLLIEKTIPERFKQNIQGKSIVIANGIDSFWHKNRHLKKRTLPNKNLHLLTVGQVCKNKNQLAVVRAAELLFSMGFNVQYTIIGEVKDWGLLNKIQEKTFVNYISPRTREELLPYYRMADFFVLPSITETFGLVYAEAMTQSLPVIYTRGQGFDRQFEEGVIGYSVKHDDPAEIASRIQKILNDYDTISENCWRLSGKYDWDKNAETYIKIYAELAKVKRGTL